MKSGEELAPTSVTLLRRLRDAEDAEAWRIFFDTYEELIRGRALKAGLTEPEARDVVQETMLSVAKAMPQFEYQPQKGSFKSWLFNLTNWRIADELRKRPPIEQHEAESSSDTTPIEQIPDPGSDSAEEWDEEWRRRLLEQAIRLVRKKADPASYQMFDLSVRKGWGVEEICERFSISRAAVYLAKHRVRRLIRKEVERLERLELRKQQS